LNIGRRLGTVDGEPEELPATRDTEVRRPVREPVPTAPDREPAPAGR
jgi:hypothetical protein